MNIWAALPLMILVATAVVALVPVFAGRGRVSRQAPAALAALGMTAAGVMAALLWSERQYAFYGAFRVDRFTVIFTVMLCVAGLATVALSLREPAGVDRRPEYYCLLVSAVTGAVLVAGAGDLIGIFLGIEILSVALYVLCAFEVWRERSLEAGLKYLIVGAVGSALLVYGLAFVFGATGSVNLATIAEQVSVRSLQDEPLLIGAAVLVIAGLGFKASAAPFHMWAPDVYEGAPSPITTFMATAVKAMAFAAFLRIFGATLIDLLGDWQIGIAVIAALAVIVGNAGALAQRSFKRMMAYSSIAQAGYLLIGVAAGTLTSARAVIFYLLVYTAMTMGAFAVMIAREREVENGQMVAALAGYGRRQPLLGVVASISLLSLAGFPPLSGFIGKFLLFQSAVDSDLTWLAVVGAVGSMISLGYYLRVLFTVWSPVPDDTHDRVLDPGTAVWGVAFVSGLMVVALSVDAQRILAWCAEAAQALIAP